MVMGTTHDIEELASLALAMVIDKRDIAALP